MGRFRAGRGERAASGVIGLLALAAAACSADSDPGGEGLPPHPTSSLPATAPATTAPSSPPEDDQGSTTTGAPTDRNGGPSATIEPDTGPVTLSFAGDIHFEGQLHSLLDDPHTALAPISGQLSSADLTVVNLETSIGTGGDPAPKRYTFQAPPAAFDALTAAGVDVVTMANNHAMDFGPDGFAETLDAAAQAAEGNPPLSVVGIGADAGAAFAPAMHDVRGTRVAVLGASVPDDPTADPTERWAAGADRPGVAVALDPQPLLDAVRDARAAADVVVVYLHWGVQGERCPSDSQADLATELADAGADVVVGSHTHRLQGAGLLGGTYVAYGLGNFVWYTQSSRTASTTGVLTLTIDDGRVADESWAPARIQDDGLPEFTGGDRADRMRGDFADLRDCADLEPLPR